MPPSNAKKVELAKRRREVATLYVRGQTQDEIAGQLGLSQGTISGDLKALKREWREGAIGDVAARVAVEVAKLEEVERAAWESYARSQRPVAKGHPPRAGDPKWLERVTRTVELRLRVLGVLKNDSTLSLNLTQVTGPLDWGALLTRQAGALDPVESKLRAVEALPPASTFEPLARLDEQEGE